MHLHDLHAVLQSEINGVENVFTTMLTIRVFPTSYDMIGTIHNYRTCSRDTICLVVSVCPFVWVCKFQTLLPIMFENHQNVFGKNLKDALYHARFQRYSQKTFLYNYLTNCMFGIDYFKKKKDYVSPH